jgi:multicomponent Na+:H+ antiporter subunit G|nr:monovalent cation/H(+) antiporter subunit G [Alphaproteobacteria bacterium]
MLTIVIAMQEILFSMFLLIGLLFCGIGILGMFRFKDIYNKQHALVLIDSMGIFFICLALAVKSGVALVSFKPLFLAIFIMILGSPACYALMQIFIKQRQNIFSVGIQKRIMK